MALHYVVKLSKCVSVCRFRALDPCSGPHNLTQQEISTINLICDTFLGFPWEWCFGAFSNCTQIYAMLPLTLFNCLNIETLCVRCNFFALLSSEITVSLLMLCEMNSSQIACAADTGMLTADYSTPLQWQWHTSFLSVTTHACSWKTAGKAARFKNPCSWQTASLAW